MGLGERIRLKREALGLTQAELGEKLGVGPNQIGAIESGRTAPSYKVFVSLAPVLGTSLDWLANGEQVAPSGIIKSYERMRLIRIIDSVDDADVNILLATADAMRSRRQDTAAEQTASYGEGAK